MAIGARGFCLCRLAMLLRLARLFALVQSSISASISSQGMSAKRWAREDCILVMGSGNCSGIGNVVLPFFCGLPAPALGFTVPLSTSPSRCSTRALIFSAALYSSAVSRFLRARYSATADAWLRHSFRAAASFHDGRMPYGTWRMVTAGGVPPATPGKFSALRAGEAGSRCK